MKKATMIFLALLICMPAHAGIVMTSTGKLKIVSIEKVQNASFDISPLREALKKGEPIEEGLKAIDHAQRLYRATDQILDVVFEGGKINEIIKASEIDGFAYGEVEVKKMADKLYKMIVSSSSVADIDTVNNVLYEIIEKARMKQSFKAEAKELERIRKIIHDAKEKADSVLTAAELAQLLENARSVLAKAKEQSDAILERAVRRQTFGAMVFCGSEVIE